MAYTEHGRGPPVVLLHGLACHLGYWLRVLPLLERVRVVAVDFRGHGLSAHRESYRYADYQRDLVALLAELGLEGAAVAGHSLGAYVALGAAASGVPIGGVLAIDVRSDWTDEDEALAERSRTATQRVDAERSSLVERLARGVAPVELSGDELDALAERSLEETEGGWRFRWDRRVLATEPVDPYLFLPRVACPVHVLSGAASEVMPPESARRFAEATPGASWEVVADAGHHVELEAPALVAERILELARTCSS